ncbi:MAG: glucosamine-6-phosphate deaminase, partial [Kiritimatiellae bacterium]|nr:glucosamine-6-phosphate deaminase [Kiritimatiellia bacterium]
MKGRAMKVEVFKTKEEANEAAAKVFVDAVNANSNIVLGLATGGTPEGLYAVLARENKAGKVSFKTVRSWNLDEYVGLPKDHPETYRNFMNRKLFDNIDIDKANTHVLDGLATDKVAECAAYEEAIKAAGGIDIQLLGIGSDGHIAFNEPGSAFDSRTREVFLEQQTIDDNARFFDGDKSKVPTSALSTGIGTILDARKIVLLAYGANKAQAVYDAVKGTPSVACP